jgi:hypothetical protein
VFEQVDLVGFGHGSELGQLRVQVLLRVVEAVSLAVELAFAVG